MDYQHYNDPSLIPFNTYNQQDFPSTASPTDLNSHWNIMSNNINTNVNMDCKEINQPERGIAGFVSKLFQ